MSDVETPLEEEPSPNPLAAVVRRMALLARACRGEFAAAPIGAFETEWNAADPADPLPRRDDYTMHRKPEWAQRAK
jgi:hypothetical protein